MIIKNTNDYTLNDTWRVLFARHGTPTLAVQQFYSSHVVLALGEYAIILTAKSELC